MAATDLAGVAAPAGLPGADRWARRRASFRAWVEDAYLHPGTPPYRLVFNLSMFLVLVSLLSMVLEGVSDLEIDYAEIFFVVETVVVLLFIADYAGSIYTSRNRWGYVFSFWGLVDLLAILPYILTVTNISGLRAARTMHSMRTARASRGLRGLRGLRAMRGLRALRVLRVIRVLKIVRHRRVPGLGNGGDNGAPGAHPAPEGGQPNLWRDFQFGLIAVCTVLALLQLFLEWEEEALFWLAFGAGAAINLAARRWCLRCGRQGWSLLVLASGVALGVAAAWWAHQTDMESVVSVAGATTVYVLASALALERRAGGDLAPVAA